MQSIDHRARAETSSRAPSPLPVVMGIVVGGMGAGLLDIFAAAAINHEQLGTILRAIASGLLGKEAFRGGQEVMAFGLELQIAMSLVIAAIYGLASVKLPILLRRPVMFGLLYGVGIFGVMVFIVVPLSAAPPRLAPPPLVAGLTLAAMLGFGLILSLTQTASSRRSRVAGV